MGVLMSITHGVSSHTPLAPHTQPRPTPRAPFTTYPTHLSRPSHHSNHDSLEQEVTVGPGDFTCFDYNREIHWIEHRALSNATLDDRMVLKLHFYEVR